MAGALRRAGHLQPAGRTDLKRNLSSRFARLAAIMLAWLWMSIAAHAHASLVMADPADGAMIGAAPASFALTFSEPVAPLAIRLIRPDGTAETLDRFKLEDRTLRIEAPAGLGHGTHVLSWRVISEDGHPVAGSLVFSIGEASVAPAVEDAVDWTVRIGLWAGKLALYVGLFIGAGGAFAIGWLLKGERYGRKVVIAAIAVGLLGAILCAGFQSLDALGVPAARLADPLVWSAGIATSFGRTLVAAVLALAAAALSLTAGGLEQLQQKRLAVLPPELRKTKEMEHFRDSRKHGNALVARLLSLAALLLAGGALAASGHASAADPQWLTRPAVFLHATAIAFWSGALVPLGMALAARQSGPGFPQSQGSRDTGNIDAALPALRRFSAAIPFVVAVLIAAGAVLAVIQVGRPSALVDTAYGNVLLVKLALLGLLFALAAFNRWRLTTPVAAGDMAASSRLVRSIAAETALVVLVLAVAACWRFTPPPRAIDIAAAQPESVHIHTLPAMADISITPARAGLVDVSVTVMTGDFGPLDAREVAVTFLNPAAGIEPIRRQAFKPGDGTWRVEGLVLPIAGTWKVRVDLLIGDFETVRLEGDLRVRP